MALFTEVDPETFIDTEAGTPASGRGAWTRVGIDFEYRYRYTTNAELRIGTRAEESLNHWAAAAGVYAIQLRLAHLGFMEPVRVDRRGVFNRKTEAGVKAFQKENKDPENDKPLVVDGIVGMSDARALFTPRLVAFERKYGIPNNLIVGQTNHESRLDPGAVGYYIYYPDYRGVDRGMNQINSRANAQVTWYQAYSINYSAKWSAARLRAYFDQFQEDYPTQTVPILWDAAVCAHNSPVNGRAWARDGEAPTEQAFNYVKSVRDANYLGK